MGQVGSLRVRFDAFELNESNARLTRNGKPLSLPPKAFGVLCALARHPGRLIPRARCWSSQPRA
jgi:DNA-binding winged helix-turn-helix (wHTH) protein